MELIFKPTALERMHQWLVQHYPEEACGFLVGRETGQRRIVIDVWPVDNISAENRKRRFIVDPVAYLQTEKRAIREEVTLLGIFHSHPDHPAIPSEHDLAAAHPFFSYTIVSVSDGAVADTKSYQLLDGSFVEEHVEPVLSGQTAVPSISIN
jgi:proteasome lid subunit RPN8/RPN11